MNFEQRLAELERNFEGAKRQIAASDDALRVLLRSLYRTAKQVATECEREARIRHVDLSS